MMHRAFVLLFATACTASPFAIGGALSDDSGVPKQTIHMVTQLDPAGRKNGRFVKLVYTDAFARLGYDMRFQFLPPARASMMASTGEADGELSRVYHYNTRYPNLVRVEEPAFSVRFSAFTTDPSIRLDGWESLRDTPFRVDYRIGSKIVDEKLTELVPTDRLSTVTHESIGIRKLLAGRTDVYVHQEEAITDLLLTEAFQIELRESFGGKIPLIAGVLEEQTIHAFLHSGIEP